MKSQLHFSRTAWNFYDFHTVQFRTQILNTLTKNINKRTYEIFLVCHIRGSMYIHTYWKSYLCFLLSLFSDKETHGHQLLTLFNLLSVKSMLGSKLSFIPRSTARSQQETAINTQTNELHTVNFLCS